MTSPDARRAEIAANLARLRQRIDAACQAASRDPAEVTLIGVTKFFPAQDAALLAEAGVPDLGESRDQEAAAKVEEVARLTDAAVTWHFIGRLQTNKARSVARYAGLVHSVDRPQLASALDAGADRAARVLPVLIQVSLDEPGAADDRGGVRAEQLPELAGHIAAAGSLRLAGLMAVAPLGADPEPAFERLAGLAAQLRVDHPGATILSAGMSGDLEAAIRHGATHVRVGTALLGRRTANFG
ncbi:MAG TPA: YggS family pyridoxal phosphate-dependent enzyme [Jatrophihabitans sp.]|nr:YggS family pyridoxal phosphate-dependent enzyme [Jatrophihabitans sp.]